MSWHQLLERSRIGGWLLAAALLAGCGGPSGPARYDLSGKVTYGGQPVPAGELTLEPDAAQGNKGPGSTVRIKAGQYRTEPGKGVVGGPYIARIVGFDGKSVPDSLEGAVLFPSQELKVELPKKNGKHDFDIPAAPR